MSYLRPSLTFVNDGVPVTLSSLLSVYPANSSRVGMYARVTDLWGAVRSVLICEYDGSTYYWRPQRTDYAVTSAQTSGTMTFTPLVTPPETALQSALLGNMSVALSTTNVWPGCRCKIWTPSSLGLFTLQFTGLIGGLTKTLLAGSNYEAIYTSAGWKA